MRLIKDAEDFRLEAPVVVGNKAPARGEAKICFLDTENKE